VRSPSCEGNAGGREQTGIPGIRASEARMRNMKTVERSFETDVIQASHAKPVVVDFRAKWCGPCQILGPIMERLVRASGGKWQLVKINVDAYPDLAGAWGVQGIPAVKMFHRGRMVAEFTGAIPEAAVVRWLSEHLPAGSDRTAAG
jgi:thioredoxin 1